VKIRLPLFCPKTEFGSDIDHQKSVTSKLLSGHGHMSNGWESGRVAQVFVVQLRDGIIWEQFHFRFFLTAVHFI
jgi:hypothetical protein